VVINSNRLNLLKNSPEYEDYSENYIIEENNKKCHDGEGNKKCGGCSKTSKGTCHSNNCCCAKRIK